MKIQFNPNLSYQQKAIKSATDVFEIFVGQRYVVVTFCTFFR